MKRVFIFLFAMMLIVSCKEQPQAEVEIVTPEEMKEISKMEEIQLVDVRTPEEYEAGFIDGFQNIDYFSDTFEKDIQELDKSKPVIVYCRSGKRSAKCSKKMIKAGFVKIYELDGGITKWQHEGFEIKSFD